MDARLSPNSRLHWARKARVVAKARLDATWTTLAANIPLPAPDGPIDLHIVFYPPDRRRRDRDNMQASLKSALDGIAFALGVDDYRFRPTYEVAEPEKPGRVEITIR